MLELKSKVAIDEKNQEVINNAMSGIAGELLENYLKI